MSNSITPLNLPTTALTVLQTRNAVAVSAVTSATDAQRHVGDWVAPASDRLAQVVAGGAAVPRGQILNILV